MSIDKPQKGLEVKWQVDTRKKRPVNADVVEEDDEHVISCSLRAHHTICSLFRQETLYASR